MWINYAFVVPINTLTFEVYVIHNQCDSPSCMLIRMSLYHSGRNLLAEHISVCVCGGWLGVLGLLEWYFNW